MAPPRIDRLFDHQVRIWRPTASIANRIGAEERTYQPVGVAGAVVNRNVSPMSDQGVGMVPTGRRRLYMRPDADVLERDVVQVIDGPDAGESWEVDQPPSRPRGHHTQVDAIAWNGQLPEVS
jgi:hypothetical protein